MFSISATKLTIAGCIVAILILTTLLIMIRRKRYSSRAASFKLRWAAVQKLCSNSKLWPQALTEADALLDDALKHCRCKGRTMGERLVSAQRRLSDNDTAWFAHKLKNKVEQGEVVNPLKKDVQTALRGMQQAMKDLGVL